MKSSGALVFLIIAASLTGCKTEEIILHSNITGLVTDSITSEPIQAASVQLNNTNDTTRTGSDGIYIFRNITPGNYDIQVSKYTYATVIKNVTVASAETKESNFRLLFRPTPRFSVSVLDFGLDSTRLSFTLSNSGNGNLTYVLVPSQPWITVSPVYGNVTSDTDKITVTINRSGLSENIYKEAIKVISFAGQDLLPDAIIPVYLNDVRDRDGNIYKVVKIGNQMWMAENLNVGTPISDDYDQKDNSIIEKYFYNNSNDFGKKYGGLYQFDEMMQYSKPDSAVIGTTQGICPDGWHIPTEKEWIALFSYLGGLQVAGGKLKDKTELWKIPNTGATNESGFSGLPGGSMSDNYYCAPNRCYLFEGEKGIWWNSYGASIFWLQSDLSEASIGPARGYATTPTGIVIYNKPAYSIRCVKN
jgi:uncharacterized protein (TIGR02145 family)